MWKIIGASEVGTSHLITKAPCQDYHLFDVVTQNDKDFLICIVSDGAGSALHGGQGAKIACTCGKENITKTLSEIELEHIGELTVIDWVANIQVEIEKEAISHSLKKRDYACTLLGAVVGPKCAVFFQIGDGAIVVSNNSVHGVVFWPDAGQYANMTNFITDDNAMVNLNTTLTTSFFNEVALFTDGIQRLALSFDQYKPHTPFFEPMFKILRELNPDKCNDLSIALGRFLNSAPVNSRTDDDKTLILAIRK